jgi:hypothetical protein
MIDLPLYIRASVDCQDEPVWDLCYNQAHEPLQVELVVPIDMKRQSVILIILFAVLACQVIPTPPPLKNTPPGIEPSGPSQGAGRLPLSPSQGTSNPASGTAAPIGSAPGEMPPFPYQAMEPFADTEMSSWEPDQPYTPELTFPVSPGMVSNWEVTAGLTTRQRAFLLQNGFVVIQNEEAQFNGIRERVATRFGQPYYLTSDAVYHALHLTLDETLAALEREELRRRMLTVTQATLDEVQRYIPLVRDTFLEADTSLAAAYLGVALKLFDPQVSLTPDLEEAIKPQIDQIMAARGVQSSALMPYIQDDFSVYKPVGHYSGSPDLEAYYRGMTWFGRILFRLQGTPPDFVASRLPLVVTLALRRARLENGESAAQEWARVQEALDFLIGPSKDIGPFEFSALMDQVYGRGVTVVGLTDISRWETILSLSQQLPIEEINPLFVPSMEDVENERGWSFMGKRSSPDGFILQNLVFDKVSTPAKKRDLPSGLDVMAALGSPAAMQSLEKTGETAYLNYPEQMMRLQDSLQSRTQAQWQNNAYNVWFYAFMAQVGAKPDAFPAYMLSTPWAYKELNTALGSWSELKHDTTQYVKYSETSSNVNAPSSGSAPGYVEPNPAVFYRLAYLASTAAAGLRERNMSGVFSGEASNLANLLDGMQALGEHLKALGDIAVKELKGAPLSQDDYNLIQAPLGPAEERFELSKKASLSGVGYASQMPPVAEISTISGVGERILHVGLGRVKRIYVLVPLEGELQAAQGGVYSYYEFYWPRDERLSDSAWRLTLFLTPLDPPGWDENFVLADGNPVDVLAFRIGDVYKITPAGAGLNLRLEPSRDAGVIRKLTPAEYVTIVDGPLQAEGFTWWKLSYELSNGETLEGWAVGQSEWYERAWGQ